MQDFRGDRRRCPGRIMLSRPPSAHFEHYIINGTMVLRKTAFVKLNGFADFYCGADTEFILRAYFSGMRFCVSHSMVAWRRVHKSSMTYNRRTGFCLDDPERRLVSAYRNRVREETLRRYDEYLGGRARLEHFGCLEPHRSRSLNCVSEPDEASPLLVSESCFRHRAVKCEVDRAVLSTPIGAVAIQKR